MSKDWKTDRTEAAIKEGTDKIMKAAQKLTKRKDPLFKEQIERAKKSLEDAEFEGMPFEICIGVGMNQLFPEYITIDLRDDEQPR
jgi:hypothetical protein